MASVNAFAEAVEQASKQTTKFVKQAVKGETFDGANKAINKVASTLGNNAFGVPEAMYRMSKNGGKIGKALNDTFRNEAGNLMYGKIAGSYIGAAAAGRVLTGGGVYKDGQGRQNLIGVPFV